MTKESRFMNEEHSEKSTLQNRAEFWRISRTQVLLLAQQINHTDTDPVTVRGLRIKAGY